jgi:hypothetical protein
MALKETDHMALQERVKFVLSGRGEAYKCVVQDYMALK